MKKHETVNAQKQITLAVELETNSVKSMQRMGPDARAPIFKGPNSLL
jgi:hypothetical protein